MFKRQQNKKPEPLTLYIKHLAESANFKGGTFNKHSNGLIGNRFEMPNVSYTCPLCFMLRKTATQWYVFVADFGACHYQATMKFEASHSR